MILRVLHDSARMQMEEWMRIEDYEFKSDLALRNQAKGRQESLALGQAKALLKVLSARGLPIADDQQEQILRCSDLELLDSWLDRALQVRSVDELLH